MSALERDIIEKFHQLKPAAKQRVRALIEQEIASEDSRRGLSGFDYAVWFREVETLRQQIRAKDQPLPLDIVGILRDIRDGEDE